MPTTIKNNLTTTYNVSRSSEKGKTDQPTNRRTVVFSQLDRPTDRQTEFRTDLWCFHIALSRFYAANRFNETKLALPIFTVRTILRQMGKKKTFKISS